MVHPKASVAPSGAETHGASLNRKTVASLKREIRKHLELHPGVSLPNAFSELAGSVVRVPNWQRNAYLSAVASEMPHESAEKRRIAKNIAETKRKISELTGMPVSEIHFGPLRLLGVPVGEEYEYYADAAEHEKILLNGHEED